MEEAYNDFVFWGYFWVICIIIALWSLFDSM